MRLNINTHNLEHALKLLGFVPDQAVFGFVVLSTFGGIYVADLTLKDTDPDPSGSVGFVDADNNSTSAADTPVWSSSDESVATVSASADGLSAVVVKTSKLGATVIGVDAHNDDGADIHAQATLTVVASEATSGEVTLTAGEAAPAANAATTTDAASGDTGDTTATDAAAPAEPDPNQPL